MSGLPIDRLDTFARRVPGGHVSIRTAGKPGRVHVLDELPQTELLARARLTLCGCGNPMDGECPICERELHRVHGVCFCGARVV